MAVTLAHFKKIEDLREVRGSISSPPESFVRRFRYPESNGIAAESDAELARRLTYAALLVSCYLFLCASPREDVRHAVVSFVAGVLVD